MSVKQSLHGEVFTEDLHFLTLNLSTLMKPSPSSSNNIWGKGQSREKSAFNTKSRGTVEFLSPSYTKDDSLHPQTVATKNLL